MVKILPAARIRELDQYTIKHEPVSSINLMERASRAFVTWFTERFHALKKVGIVCGTGNNGGDGLAIARLLKDWGYPVKVWILEGGATRSEDFQINYERLKDAQLDWSEVASVSDQNIFEGRDVLIDAIFGSGLSRPVEGIYAQVIGLMNAADCTRVAVDIPSGLMADKPSSGAIVEAHHTVSFQIPKLCFFLPQSYRYTGEWHLCDIGLSKEFIQQSETDYFFVNKKSVKKLLKSRGRFDHKGSYGHALLVAGSHGKIGAAVLAGESVIRAGAGLLTIYSPRCGYSILQSSVPEAMVISDEDEYMLTKAPELDRFDVAGIGPGLGQHPETVKMLTGLLGKCEKPVVLDADALNIISENRELLHVIPAGSILTPHPKEFERLVGRWKDDFERLALQKALARQLNSVVVVKGAYTAVATADGKVYFNSTGNPGMATGGTGDVLTGILTGLLAQGYSAADAAVLGVFLHGWAGDLALPETGMESLIASDIIRFLPAAFRQLRW